MAKPSVMSDERLEHAEHPVGHAALFCDVSAPMTAHCSAVDSSMRVNVVAMSIQSVRRGLSSTSLAASDPVVEAAVAPRTAPPSDHVTT